MLVLNLPFKALMFLTLMRPSLVLFLVLWLKLVKDFLKVRCRLALLPFLISCLIWLDLVASLPLIKERILVIILLLHFLSLMLGSVLVLMLPLLVWWTPDLRIKKSLLKCNWTIRKRLTRWKMRLKKRLLSFSRRLHARIRKARYMHKMRCVLINRRSLLLALRLLCKTPIFPTKSSFFFLNDTAPPEIYPLPLPDPFPILRPRRSRHSARRPRRSRVRIHMVAGVSLAEFWNAADTAGATESLLPRHFGTIPSLSEREKRSEEHTSELQSPCNLVCRLLLEKK